MTEQPQTYEEHLELLRSLIEKHSFIQFEIGKWAVETLDRFGGTCKDLADEINIGNTTLNEWVNVRRFWLTEDLPAELVERIAMLDEGLQANLLNYSHFRKARRQAVAQTKDRVEGVRLAVEYLEHILDDNVKHSVMDAEVAAITGGEAFAPSKISFDTRDHKAMPLQNVLFTIKTQIDIFEQEQKPWRLVLYAEVGNG